MSSYVIEKTLNNNVIICRDETHQNEVVLIGKGIGFNKKKRNAAVRYSNDRKSL